METNEQKRPFHVMVAEKLIAQLEQGTAPWQKPWEPGTDLPMNPVSGKRYRGINALHLMSEGRGDPRWLTYRQARMLDAQVRRGEKGTLIQYWKFAEERPLERDGKPVLDGRGGPAADTVDLERPRVFFATVFNAEQIDGLPGAAPRAGHDWDPVERAERIVLGAGALVRHGERDAAYYRPLTDSIHLPDRRQFPDAAAYYAVLLHELGHWTGNARRLGRDLAHPFGSEGYAREELRAEIASLMLGSEIGIAHDPLRHAAYVGSWIRALRDDPFEIFRAAADAEKICGYVLGFERQQEQDLLPEVEAHPIAVLHPAAVVAPDGTVRDWDSDAELAAGWQGVVEHRGAFWHAAGAGGERSFTLLASRAYPAAEAEAARLQALSSDFADVLGDPQAFPFPYRGRRDDSLEAAMRRCGLTSIGSVTGGIPATFLETAEDRLSAVFDLEPGQGGTEIAYLERAHLAQAFADAARRLVDVTNEESMMNARMPNTESTKEQDDAQPAMRLPDGGGRRDARTPFEINEDARLERQRRAEAWTLDHLEQGTMEYALDKATPAQLNRVAQVLEAMLPLDHANRFWNRHEYPQDAAVLRERIVLAQPMVAVRREDGRVAASRAALVGKRAFGKEHAIELAAFEREAGDVLGLTLPDDWNGDVRVEGTVTVESDGDSVVVPAASRGLEPEAWGIYTGRADGDFQWLANRPTEQDAALLAERLARIDAHSTLNVYEKAAKLARIHEARVRRDPDSGQDELAAARERRKDAEADMTIHDEDLQQRIDQAGRDQHSETVAHEDRAVARTLIAVPYKERQEAKALGARWDRRQQSWYVPDGVDVALFAKWTNQGIDVGDEASSRDLQDADGADGRIYLAVPYKDREQAQTAGAQWDQAAGSWYAPRQADAAALAKWLPASGGTDQDPAMTPREEFSVFLQSLGFVLAGRHPIMDGKPHRVSVTGQEAGQQAGAGFYIGHLDGHPAGYAKNNVTGQGENWRAKGYALDSEERAKLATEAAAKQKQREAELAQRHERAAQRVTAQLAALVPVTQPTPYLLANGLDALPGAYTDRDGKKTYLPAVDADGKQWTMLYVQADGTERFAKDGRKEACFHVVGQGLDDIGKAPVIVIGRGYASAATLRQALGHATVATFDARNLAPVAQSLHRKYPDKPIVIACDDDRHLELTQGTNPGRAEGEKAARLVGGTVLLPVFAPGENAYPDGLDPVTPRLFREHQRSGNVLTVDQLAALERMKQFTDFHDLAHRSALGRDAVERQVQALDTSSGDACEKLERQELQRERSGDVQEPGGALNAKPRRRAVTHA